MQRTRVAEMRLYSRVLEGKIGVVPAPLPAITPENPLRLAKLLILNKLKLAERVGFEPDHLPQNL
jgi:hypothetical protein